MCVCVVLTCTQQCMCEDLFPPCGPQGLNSGRPVWQQAARFIEWSRWSCNIDFSFSKDLFLFMSICVYVTCVGVPVEVGGRC